jgi:hypothetical protein
VVFGSGYLGVFRYDRQHNRAVQFAEEMGFVNQLFRVSANDDLPFAAKKGAFRYEPKQSRVLPIGGADGDIAQITAFDNSEIWFAGAGGAFRYDFQRKRAALLEGSPSFIAEIISLDKGLWFTRNGTNIFRYDAQNKRSVEVDQTLNWTLRPQIASINGQIWFATGISAYRYDPSLRSLSAGGVSADRKHICGLPG